MLSECHISVIIGVMIVITLYRENVISDLRRNNVSISEEAFDVLNEFIDIENSEAKPLSINRWQDTKGKLILFIVDNEVIAIYNKDKFLYNPQRLKISQSPEYDLYEITVGGVNVRVRRQQREDDLSGLIPTTDSPYEKTPTGTQYIFDKDWNPKTNKVYYSKLLQRKKLDNYAKMLEDAYDVIIALINQRKDRLTGKRTVYNKLIGDIQHQISRIEDLMINSERDYAADPEKLKKEISKLPGLVRKAKEFMDTETAEYATWGKRKKIPLDPITK